MNKYTSQDKTNANACRQQKQRDRDKKSGIKNARVKISQETEDQLKALGYIDSQKNRSQVIASCVDFAYTILILYDNQLREQINNNYDHSEDIDDQDYYYDDESENHEDADDECCEDYEDDFDPNGKYFYFFIIAIDLLSLFIIFRLLFF